MMRFALLNFRRTKKSWCLLMGVMILAYTFLTMLLIFFSSMNRSEEEQREKLYGSWHVALLNADGETREKLEHHATLERMGASRIYGKVLDQEGEELGKAGTADPNTMEMENIELMEGRFPQAEDEAAVERSSFSTLGAEPRLGETIEVRLAVRDSAGEQIITRTYKVVGILQDYSEKMKGTTVDKHDYVTLLLTEQSGLSAYSERWNLVFRLQEKYLQNYGELMMISGYQGNMLLNNYTYFELGEESGYQWRKERGRECIIVIVVAVLCWVIICKNIVVYLRGQEKNIRLLLFMGCNRKRIVVDKINYLIGVNTFSVLLGGGGGYFIVGLFLTNRLQRILNKEIVYGVSLIFMITNLLIVGLICFYKFERVSKNIKRVVSVPFNRMAICNIFSFGTVKWFISTIIIVGSICIFCLDYLNYNYNQFREYIGEQIKVGTLFKHYPTDSVIEQKEFYKLQNIYGIDRVEVFKTLNYLCFNVKNKEKSEYISMLEQTYWKKYSGFDFPQVYVINISSNSLAYDYYIGQIDEGVIDEKEFSAGNCLIVYLPTYEISGNEEFGLYNKKASLIKTKKVYNENILEVDDVLEITGEQGDVQVKIGGIIKQFKDDNVIGKVSHPYTIIVSDKLYDKLKATDQDEIYSMLLLNFEENINIYQAEAELSQIKLENNYDDYKEIHSDMLNQFVKSSYIIGIIGIGLSAMVSAYSFYFIWRNREMYLKYYRLMYVLGYNKNNILKILLEKEAKYAVLSIAIALNIIPICKIIDQIVIKRIGTSRGIEDIMRLFIDDWVKAINWNIMIYIFILTTYLIGQYYLIYRKILRM